MLHVCVQTFCDVRSKRTCVLRFFFIQYQHKFKIECSLSKQNNTAHGAGHRTGQGAGQKTSQKLGCELVLMAFSPDSRRSD